MKKYVPPMNVALAAKSGLEMRSLYGRGGTSVGLWRAKQLSERRPLTLITIKKMDRFFKRHYKNRNTDPDKGNGMIAWLLWGGNPGMKWVSEILKRIE